MANGLIVTFYGNQPQTHAVSFLLREPSFKVQYMLSGYNDNMELLPLMQLSLHSHSLVCYQGNNFIVNATTVFLQ